MVITSGWAFFVKKPRKTTIHTIVYWYAFEGTGSSLFSGSRVLLVAFLVIVRGLHHYHVCNNYLLFVLAGGVLEEIEMASGFLFHCYHYYA